MIKKNKNLFGTNTENIYIDKLSVTNKKTQRENYINQIKDYYNKINKNILKNILFYKNLSFKMIINIENTKHLFNSSSSSIIKNPYNLDQFIINTRIINYCLDNMGKSTNKGEICITINKLSVTDLQFNELNFEYLYPVEYNTKYVGIEDIRLFNFKDEIYFIGSLYNPKNNKVEIVSNKYTLGQIYNTIIIKPTFKTDFNWEKNWVFFNNNDELNVIYKWDPIYICKIDYDKKELNLIRSIEKLPSIFSKFRGSTNGIEYNDKIWFIVHQQNNVIDDIKSYLHNFVVFDKNMNLLGYSEAFNFENKLVEFCVGMEFDSNSKNFIITYSTLDSTTKLTVFSPDYVNSLITYI